MIDVLADSLRWPPEARDGPEALFQRAMHQAGLLEETARRSGGQLRILRYREDLREYLLERRLRRDLIAGILCIEGAQVLHGDLGKLDRLFAAGFRMMGLVHHFDNEVGGSTHGLERGGLTEFGREVIRRMAELGMIVDLAHASPKLLDDVLAEARSLFPRPALAVSHTGIQFSKPTLRHLTDEQIVSIMSAGGLVGLGYFMGEEWGNTVHSYARMFGHVAGLAPDAVNHLALGSDFDGLVAAPVDASELAQVTDALLRVQNGIGDRVFTPKEVRGIMGDNALRFLSRGLPRRPPGLRR